MVRRMAAAWTKQGASPDEVRDRALRLVNRSLDILERGTR
jgi:hypothetical protein